MLADLDVIGTVLIVVVGVISYVVDYMKKQKAEAASRRTLQQEFEQRARERRERVDAAAQRARQLEEKLRSEAVQPSSVKQPAKLSQPIRPRAAGAPMQPRHAATGPQAPRSASPVHPARASMPLPSAQTVPVSLEENLPDFEVTMPDLETSMPDLESSMPDAEEVARRRMQRRAGEGGRPLAPPTAAQAEMSHVAAMQNDAEKAALDALRSGRSTSRSRQVQKPLDAAPAFGRLDAGTIRQAIVYKEILDRPVALR